MLTREQIQVAATGAGYPVESYEKVLTLLKVLDGVRGQ